MLEHQGLWSNLIPNSGNDRGRVPMFTFLLLSSLALGVLIAIIGSRGTKDHDERKKRDYWH